MPLPAIYAGGAAVSWGLRGVVSTTARYVWRTLVKSFPVSVGFSIGSIFGTDLFSILSTQRGTTVRCRADAESLAAIAPDMLVEDYQVLSSVPPLLVTLPAKQTSSDGGVQYYMLAGMAVRDPSSNRWAFSLRALSLSGPRIGEEIRSYMCASTDDNCVIGDADSWFDDLWNVPATAQARLQAIAAERATEWGLEVIPANDASNEYVLSMRRYTTLISSHHYNILDTTGTGDYRALNRFYIHSCADFFERASRTVDYHGTLFRAIASERRFDDVYCAEDELVFLQLVINFAKRKGLV